jgi:hypothetical protein
VRGSPFATFIQAEEACERMLVQLTSYAEWCDHAEPHEPLFQDQASLDPPLAFVVDRGPTALDYGAAGARSGVAPPRWSQMDLQEVWPAYLEQGLIPLAIGAPIPNQSAHLQNPYERGRALYAAEQQLFIVDLFDMTRNFSSTAAPATSLRRVPLRSRLYYYRRACS